ncbi:hypothetical protein SAMN05216581_3648 [Pseudomonas asplenii]|uniref:Uncharacterized protein n=2 Tax=Pseudomonas asplenii TaxID=53407 RepID=A0A1H6NQD7_9PSED|nr:hypothetical protein SAMN05216581_3648 [Pseudomonas fuscovaginae]
MMSAHTTPLEMHERLHTVDNPFYGERDYSFSFEFYATEPIWQTHAVDYVSSDLAKPNIWMGESREDHYVTRSESEVWDERVFAERECKSFTLFCREGQLHLVLTVWGEDADAKKLPRSRYDKRFTTIATRQVAGKGDFLRLAHEQPCVIKLETQDGLSRVKVWNTRETGQEPFILDVPDESFRDFFAGFTTFQFNAVPSGDRTGKHSLMLQRVAAWRGNTAPEGKQNFRDCLEQQKNALQHFGFRQLPLEHLTAHYPLQNDRWSLLEQPGFFALKPAGPEWRAGQGLGFNLDHNQCRIALRATAERGACASLMLDIQPGAANLARITTLAAQVDAWARSEAGFTLRNHRLKFRTILAQVQAFDASQPFSLSLHDRDATLAAIEQGQWPAGLGQFMAQLKVSRFSERSTLSQTLTQLQAALKKDQALNDQQTEELGILTLKMSAPEASMVFHLRICRSMTTDPATGTLRYEQRLVFQDSQGEEQGAFALQQSSGFLLLCLSDDRQAFELFFADSGRELATSLTASWGYSLAQVQGAVKGQVIDEVTLDLGRDGGTREGSRIALRHLSCWNRALWKREGLIGAEEKPDPDYNVKTLAHLHFSGLFGALLDAYLQSRSVALETAPA